MCLFLYSLFGSVSYSGYGYHTQFPLIFNSLVLQDGALCYWYFENMNLSLTTGFQIGDYCIMREGNFNCVWLPSIGWERRSGHFEIPVIYPLALLWIVVFRLRRKINRAKSDSHCP